MNSHMVPITIAFGDGIGPEIMYSTLEVLHAAGAAIAPEFIEIGESVYLSGYSSGITPELWDSLRRTRVFLKAPITTPQGGGYKSLNVTIRKTLGLYANIRPVASYHPFVRTKHPKMDVVIVRENEEDLYAGIEHRQTEEVYQCLKIITRPGTEKVIRYAFEYARRNNRKKVACFTKDNIMKLTDGLFHKVFDEVAREYPDLAAEHYIVDIGAALLADRPQDFDVIVTPNLYGDVISDIAAQIAGSVGMAGSSNIGENVAMFEAIHGSAPKIAGMNKANPSGLLSAAVMMLVHIGQPEAATRVQNALLRTIEDGIHTEDIYDPAISKQLVGTREFTQAVIYRLGMAPVQLPAAAFASAPPPVTIPKPAPVTESKRQMVGVDVFLNFKVRDGNRLGSALQPLSDKHLHLSMITNRGVKVWPDGLPETFCTDHWRCRFIAKDGGEVGHKQILGLLSRIHDAGFDFIKTENLCTFDGVPGFSLGQGQ